MNIKSLLHKLYYYSLNSSISTVNLTLPKSLHTKKNLFIYFDYEREYSGQVTKISDTDINSILEILSPLGIKSTWFTVGKLFEQYPESIELLLRENHEIGSHTFDHISPLYTSKRRLAKDFEKFYDIIPKDIQCKGFHSPKGEWSLSLLYLLRKYDFEYDITTSKSKDHFPRSIRYKGLSNIVRFSTIGDDWPLYKTKVDEDEVSNYFVSLYNEIKIGSLAGLGFHPWVLISNPNILIGFQRFVEYLSTEPELQIQTLQYYYKELTRTGSV